MSEVIEDVYDIKEETSYGQVQIAGDVVAVIAGIAASEVDGVYKLQETFQMRSPAGWEEKILQRELRWILFPERSE